MIKDGAKFKGMIASVNLILILDANEDVALCNMIFIICENII